jgi:hypothetical protein
MIGPKRSSAGAGALAVGLAAAALLATDSAASQTSVRFPVEQPVQVSARVALLEQRVHRLEQRLSAFEQVGLRTRSDGTRQLTLNGTIVIVEPDGRVTVTPRASDSAPALSGRLPTESPECDPPFYYDSDGIKRFKGECL